MRDLESLSREELVGVVLEQARQIKELRAELEMIKRGGNRSAAPFSMGRRAERPKTPGRKPGEGPFERRRAPEEIASVEARRVAVESTCCPDCGGVLVAAGVELASVTELPDEVRPEVRLYEVEVRCCGRCGRKVRGRHADLAADQYGATAHRIGPRAKAAAHALHYGLGVPVRKTPLILELLTGLKVTQGALTQDALKQAGGEAGKVYARLRDGICHSPVVHTDDTGWRTGGETAQLMVFDTPDQTVYQIRPRHRNEEVREVIPADYTGVLVSDRGKSYDAEELTGVKQQKCLAHLIRNINEVLASKQGKARHFGLRLKQILRDALKLWHQERHGKNVASRSRRLEEGLTHHLRCRILRDKDNQKLLDGIGLQHDRGHVLRFLHDSKVEPTNNRAERALRPAVIARKVSHCSKNVRGAEAFATFISIIQTIRKKGLGLVDTLVNLSVLHSSPIASP